MLNFILVNVDMLCNLRLVLAFRNILLQPIVKRHNGGKKWSASEGIKAIPEANLRFVMSQI